MDDEKRAAAMQRAGSAVTPQDAISALLVHLAETTIERDRARAQAVALERELDGTREEVAAIRTELASLQEGAT